LIDRIVLNHCVKSIFHFYYKFHLTLLQNLTKKHKTLCQTQINKWRCTLLHVSIPKESTQDNSYKTFKTHHSLKCNEKHEEEL